MDNLTMDHFNRIIQCAYAHFRALSASHLLDVHLDLVTRLFAALVRCGVAFPLATVERLQRAVLTGGAQVSVAHRPVLWAETLESAFCMGDIERHPAAQQMLDELFLARTVGCGWGFQPNGPSSVPVTARLLIAIAGLKGLDLSGHEQEIREVCDWLASEWDKDLKISSALPFKGGFVLLAAARLRTAGLHASSLIDQSLLERTVEYLLTCQLKNGAWTFVLPNNPIERLQLPLSSPLYTAIISLGLIGWCRTMLEDSKLLAKVEQCLEQARCYLYETSLPTGFWPCPTNDVFTSTLAYGLQALSELENLADRRQHSVRGGEAK